jgi:AcrR family transcriptional regulator
VLGDGKAEEPTVGAIPGAGSTWVHAPRQARSQETFERFLSATDELLGEHSFDQITVTDIVQRADRTVGSFYARFDDKYAVLYELVSRSYARIRAEVRIFCEPSRWDGQALSIFVIEAVRLNVASYRQATPLFRAALRASTSDDRFRQIRIELMRFCADQQKSFLLSRQDEILATDPSRASDHMFEVIVAVLDQELLFGRLTRTSPRSDHEICREIADQALHAIGITAPSEAAPAEGSDTEPEPAATVQDSFE